MARSLLLSAAFVVPAVAGAQLTPTRLRTEYLVDPIGIDIVKPRLSWVDESPVRGARQKAYQVLVASDPAMLAKGQGDLWNSGQVASAQSTHVEYGGKPLRSGQRAYWRVTVWDGATGQAKSSRLAFWEAGLVNRGDWRAQWVGMPDAMPKPKDMRQGHWLWYPEGNPAQDAPSGTRYFRYSFDLPEDAVKSALFGLAVDDTFSVKVNGVEVGSGGGWTEYKIFNVEKALKYGRNTMEITATNDHSRAGLLFAGQVDFVNGKYISLWSGPTWEVSLDGKEWIPAKDLAPFGGRPYGVTKWNEASRPSPILRRKFEVDAPVVRARVYASAKGLYDLYIDGKKVGRDVFSPGWTDYRIRIQYQTYDVTKLLGRGKHTIGMVLGDGWYCGHVGLTGGTNYGPKPMGLAQMEIEYADGRKERIFTGDEGWGVKNGPIRTNDLLMGETYDARLKAKEWSEDELWFTPDMQPRGPEVLVAQRSETVQKLEELKPLKITEPKPGVFVYDLGQNMVGWARLRAQGPSGTQVRLRFAEMLNPDGTVYTTNLRGAKATDYYTLSGKGREVYEPSFTFHGFRYVEVTGFPGKPGKDAITGVVLSSNTPKTGTFECSNPLVNQLQHNIFWGQRGNYLDVPTDCPQRDERLGWMGDAQVFAPTAAFNNGVGAFLTKWTQDVVDAQSEAGGFPDVAPRMGDLADGAPAWGDAGVIVPWSVYQAYGDRRLLQERYPSMKKWIAYIDSENPDHIWAKRANNNFGDWLNVHDDTPRPVLATAYFARSTELVAKSARILGYEEDARKYEALHAAIKKAFNEKFVAVDGVVAGDTQTSYVIALAFDLLPEAMRPIAAKKLTDHILIDRKGHLSTGFLGVGLLNPTLTSVGRSDVAYKLLMNDTYPSWGYSIRQGATTIWERWDGWTEEKGFQDPGMNSFNHYSLGAVGEWMYRTVAGIGIDPERPGYENIIVHPIPGGDFTWAKGSLDSMRGKIESGWKLDGKRFTLDLTIPANATATVYVPAKDASGVREGNGLASAAEGVRFVRMENGFAVYSVGGGKYRFQSELP